MLINRTCRSSEQLEVAGLADIVCAAHLQCTAFGGIRSSPVPRPGQQTDSSGCSLFSLNTLIVNEAELKARFAFAAFETSIGIRIVTALTKYRKLASLIGAMTEFPTGTSP